MLGQVDTNGTIRFASADINDCRQFLTSYGMECDRNGWSNGKWRGAIQFHQNEWHAFIWYSTPNPR